MLPVTKGAWCGAGQKPATDEKLFPLVSIVQGGVVVPLSAGIVVFYALAAVPWKLVDALIVPVTVAVAGFGFTWWHGRLVRRRETAQKDREIAIER
jgi:hypothetical protein